MPSNYTPNYQLNQWEPEDRILRMDFNADNAKIDAALGGLLERIANLERIAANLSYHVGQLSLVDSLNRGVAFSKHAVIYDSFFSTEGYTLTGGAALVDHRVKLSGVGAVGSMTTKYGYYPPIDVRNLQLWTHVRGGSIRIFINGTSMTQGKTFSDICPTGGNCDCLTFTWTGRITHDCEIRFELDCGKDSSMEIYDFCVGLL